MMAMKPLMLKDFLEIDANSDSSDGFGCAPGRPGAATVRSLLDAEQLGGRMMKSRSGGALTRISAVINAVRLFSSSAAARAPSGYRQSRFLPRSFSKRLRRSFCKGREEEVEIERRVRVRDIVRLRSFEEDGDERRSRYFPSPVVSSCSSSSSEDGDSSGSDFLLSSCGSSVCSGENDVAADGGRRDSPKKSFSPGANAVPEGRLDVGAADDYLEEAAGGREAKEEVGQEMECQKCNSDEEKEQLSPTSVMVFPYGDEEDQEEEEAAMNTPPCFRQTFANIERTRHQLLQKIRRFESIADLDPVDLDARFASLADPPESSDHVASDAESSGLAAEDEEAESGTGTVGEERAWGLLRLLESRAPWVPQGCWSIEKLLVDFFVEGMLGYGGGSPLQWRRRAKAASHRGEEEDEEELLTAASDWLRGGGGGCGAVYGDGELKEMDRNGRWRCFEDQEEDVAADLEGSVLGSLLEELVLDLVSC